VWERINADNSAVLDEARGLAKQLHEKLISRLDHQLSLSLLKRHLDELKALKIVNGEIEGKNETERNARMTLALRSDADANRTVSDIQSEEHTIGELDAEIEHLRNGLSLLRSQLRWNIAAAQAWGGPDDD